MSSIIISSFLCHDFLDEAAICELNVSKVLKYGGRKELPSPMEITATMVTRPHMQSSHIACIIFFKKFQVSIWECAIYNFVCSHCLLRMRLLFFSFRQGEIFEDKSCICRAVKKGLFVSE